MGSHAARLSRLSVSKRRVLTGHFVEARTSEANSDAMLERLSATIERLKSLVTGMDSAYTTEFRPGVADTFTAYYIKGILTNIRKQFQALGVRYCTWKEIERGKDRMEGAVPLAEGEWRDPDAPARQLKLTGPRIVIVIDHDESSWLHAKFRLLNSAMIYDCLSRANVANSKETADAAKGRMVKGRENKRAQRAQKPERLRAASEENEEQHENICRCE